MPKILAKFAISGHTAPNGDITPFPSSKTHSVSAQEFLTAYHEMGHTMYQRSYSKLRFFHRDSPSPAFHEAVADVAALNAGETDNNSSSMQCDQ